MILAAASHALDMCTKQKFVCLLLLAFLDLLHMLTKTNICTCMPIAEFHHV